VKSIDFGSFILEFESHFIKLILKDGAHFDGEKFENSYDLKSAIYGDKKIGVLIERTDPNASYSFDPLILLNNLEILEKQVLWVVVVSEKALDYGHLEFVKQMTKLKCMAVSTCEEAKQWIAENF
jgi:hypothetical protein|tara:strand:+ start:70 stop:444 length:375 start_codon:yes stop_codon:yes gene_type:complete